MSGRYANKTCVDCGIMRPANLMKRESRKVKGKIGGGFSGSPFAGSGKVGKSIRVSSSRTTVRTREVWVCGDRAAHNDPDYYIRQSERLADEERRAEQARLEKQRVSIDKESRDNLEKEMRSCLGEIEKTEGLQSRLEHAKARFISRTREILESAEFKVSAIPTVLNFYKTKLNGIKFIKLSETAITEEDFLTPLEANLSPFVTFASVSFLVFIPSLVFKTIQYADLIDLSKNNELVLNFAVIISLGLAIVFFVLALMFQSKPVGPGGLLKAKTELSKEITLLENECHSILTSAYDIVAQKFGNEEHFETVEKRIFGESFKRKTKTSSLLGSIKGMSPDMKTAEVTGQLTSKENHPHSISENSSNLSGTNYSNDSKIYPHASGSDLNLGTSEIDKNVIRVSTQNIKNDVAEILGSENALTLVTWILLEKVMNADGVIDPAELNWFQNEFDIDKSEVAIVGRVANDPRALNLAVLMFNKLFPRHPKKRELLINNLFALAVADGNLAVEEEQMIRQIAKLIKMTDENYQRMLDAMKKETGRPDSSTLLAEDIFDELEELGDVDDIDIDET